MHFEILVEDLSGKELVQNVFPKIVDSLHHTYRCIAYKGIGHIPKNQKTAQDAHKRILLEQLPRLLAGYGKTYQHYVHGYAVIVICDLDRRDKFIFLTELQELLDSIQTQPKTKFCFAIEECEAWLLGDIPAIIKAYPKAKNAFLQKYVNDSICNTWEMLADAIYNGGAKKLKAKGWVSIGTEKSIWAKNISPHMDIENNKSPSFNFFKNTVKSLQV